MRPDRAQRVAKRHNRAAMDIRQVIGQRPRHWQLADDFALAGADKFYPQRAGKMHHGGELIELLLRHWGVVLMFVVILNGDNLKQQTYGGAITVYKYGVLPETFGWMREFI